MDKKTETCAIRVRYHNIYFMFDVPIYWRFLVAMYIFRQCTMSFRKMVNTI
uniref:Uncharacterized protein n=1 Tax=Octopus bimaculoides TaxID=37653 RepID=A0A0L8HZD8_OCTBM